MSLQGRGFRWHHGGDGVPGFNVLQRPVGWSQCGEGHMIILISSYLHTNCNQSKPDTNPNPLHTDSGPAHRNVPQIQTRSICLEPFNNTDINRFVFLCVITFVPLTCGSALLSGSPGEHFGRGLHRRPRTRSQPGDEPRHS